MFGFMAIFVMMVGWSYLKFKPNSPLPHHRITITLPYSPNDEPTGIQPLGEKEDVHPDGHGGIDFQWDYSPPLIATMDGKITSVAKAKDMSEPVLYVTLRQGDYTSIYKELGMDKTIIKRGAQVKQGDFIGYPHCVRHKDGHTGCQVHWEFGYASFPGSERLCPLTYFNAEARISIDATWGKILPNHRNPTGQKICNGEFETRDE